MRYRDILREYVRDITKEKLGEKIFVHLGKDNSNYYAVCINQAAQDRKTTPPLRARAVNYASNLVLNYCEEADPTPTNSYVGWILNRWFSGGIKQLEDIRSTVADALDEYDEIKRSGYFRRTTDETMKRAGDINTLKSLYELNAVIRSVPTSDRLSNTAADRKRGEELLATQATLVCDTAICRIVIPRTQEASCYFGRNTQWCTAAKRNNMFDSYNSSGPLYIVLDKANNRRWQFHPGTGNFMDENDEEMSVEDWNAVPAEARVAEYYEEAFAKKFGIKTTILLDMMRKKIQPFASLAKQHWSNNNI